MVLNSSISEFNIFIVIRFCSSVHIDNLISSSLAIFSLSLNTSANIMLSIDTSRFLASIGTISKDVFDILFSILAICIFDITVISERLDRLVYVVFYAPLELSQDL